MNVSFIVDVSIPFKNTRCKKKRSVPKVHPLETKDASDNLPSKNTPKNPMGKEGFLGHKDCYEV